MLHLHVRYCGEPAGTGSPGWIDLQRFRIEHVVLVHPERAFADEAEFLAAHSHAR